MTRNKSLALASLAIGAAIAAIAFGPAAANLGAQEPDQGGAKPQAKGQMPDLVKGLKETPGVLGVETARTSSGKNVIFAWFENKKAAVAWYKSPTHKFYMDMMGGAGRPPMAQVPDDGKPILCIASLTPAKEQKVEGAPMNLSQISIELYSVVPGGASIGGTFAPATLKIPNHVSYEDEPKPAAKADEKPKS